MAKRTKDNTKKNPTENSTLLEYTPDTLRIEKLRMLIDENALRPIELRRSKYDLLLQAGYSPEKARGICGILIEKGEQIQIDERGFNEQSAKLVIQEIAHDDSVRADTRLKAAETMLEVLGVYKKGGDGAGNGVAQTLANILSDIYKSSEEKPKLLTVKEVSNA